MTATLEHSHFTYRILSIFSAALIVAFSFMISPARADHFGSGGSNCTYAGSGFNGGSLLGAALGGFAGSHIGGGSGRLAATALGVFLGSAIGSSAGSRCRTVTSSRYSGSTPYYREVRPHSHSQPQRYYYQAPVTRVVSPAPRLQTVIAAPAEQTVCREYTAEAMIAGELQPIFGTACRQADGSWRIVSQDFGY